MSASSDRVLRLICYAGVLERLLKIESGLKAEMATTVFKVPSLDIRELLKRIEGKSKGPKKVMIDPSELADLGGDIPKVPGVATVQ
jgi:hypothetical protein